MRINEEKDCIIEDFENVIKKNCNHKRVFNIIDKVNIKEERDMKGIRRKVEYIGKRGRLCSDTPPVADKSRTPPPQLSPHFTTIKSHLILLPIKDCLASLDSCSPNHIARLISIHIKIIKVMAKNEFKVSEEFDVTILAGDTTNGEFAGMDRYTITPKIPQVKNDELVMTDNFTMHPINRDVMLSKLGIARYNVFKTIGKAACKGRLISGSEVGLIFQGAKIHIKRVFCEKDSKRILEDGTEIGTYSNDIYKTIIESVEMPKEAPVSDAVIMNVITAVNKSANDTNDSINWNF